MHFGWAGWLVGNDNMQLQCAYCNFDNVPPINGIQEEFLSSPSPFMMDADGQFAQTRFQLMHRKVDGRLG